MAGIVCRFGQNILNSAVRRPITLSAWRTMSDKTYELVTVEKVGAKNNVGLITMNSPRTLNALNDALIDDIRRAAEDLSEDKDVGCIVLTGKGKAFAAGADIKQMQPMTFQVGYSVGIFDL